jgi:hypothetical protein
MIDPADAQLAESLRLLFPGVPAIELAAQRLEAREEISEAMVERFADRFIKDYPEFWDRQCAECVGFAPTTVPIMKFLNTVRAALKVAGGVRG